MLRVLKTLATGAVFAAAITGAFAQVQQQQGPKTPPKVATKNGSYVGLYLPTYNQDAFLGMRYAEPPVGNLRYRNPQPLNATWTTPRNATEYSPMCYGLGPQGGNPSEDCLTLNVVRPHSIKNGNLPVAVYIHGGAYIVDSARDLAFNLSYMVDQSVKMHKPIIGVSLEYRLQGWGFMWGSAVKAAGVGNLGLKDQRLALHWIQENIAAFGGDPKKVTVFGESAGGGSIGNQILAYGGRDDGLFRSAIIESMDVISNGYVAAEAWDPFYNQYLALANCTSASDTLDCLRQVPAEKLNAIFNTMPLTLMTRWFPVIDGDFLQETGKSQLIKGKFVKVPLLQGTNHDEGTMFSPTGLNTEAEFIAYMTGELPVGTLGMHYTKEEATILSKLYPDIPSIGIPPTLHDRPAFNSTLGAQYKRVAAFTGDAIMHAGRRYMGQTWAKNKVPVYNYLFNTFSNGYAPEIGVEHFMEVSYVFYNIEGVGYDPSPYANRPESYKRLAKLMCRMWISFFNDQTPNHSGETDVQWPLYTDGDDAQILVFDVNATEKLAYVTPDTYRAEGIAYLQSLYE